MPPAPAPAMAKRLSRLQNVLTASPLQSQGETTNTEREEEDDVYESACAAPASPNVSRKSSTASVTGGSTARSPLLPPSSTQGVAVSTRVRQALSEAARRAPDASRQYRAAFRAYSEAWNSPDTPAETQVRWWRACRGRKKEEISLLVEVMIALNTPPSPTLVSALIPGASTVGPGLHLPSIGLQYTGSNTSGPCTRSASSAKEDRPPG
jgi:hypothetical protein